MSVIQATSYELIEILYLLKVKYLESNSSDHFEMGLQSDQVQSDIQKGLIYIYKTDGVTLGLIRLDKPLSDILQASTTLHHELNATLLVVHPFWTNKGIEHELLTSVEELVTKQGHPPIKISLSSDYHVLADF